MSKQPQIPSSPSTSTAAPSEPKPSPPSSSSKTNATAVRSGCKGGRHTTNFSSSIISRLAQGNGEYFTRLGVETPLRYSYMVLDTDSDICRKCYTQSDPVFDPEKPSSFVEVTCGSPLCRRLDFPSCNQRKKCMYQVSYDTIGEFSTKTMMFRRTRVNNVAMTTNAYSSAPSFYLNWAM